MLTGGIDLSPDGPFHQRPQITATPSGVSISTAAAAHHTHTPTPSGATPPPVGAAVEIGATVTGRLPRALHTRSLPLATHSTARTAALRAASRATAPHLGATGGSSCRSLGPVQLQGPLKDATQGHRERQSDAVDACGAFIGEDGQVKDEQGGSTAQQNNETVRKLRKRGPPRRYGEVPTEHMSCLYSPHRSFHIKKEGCSSQRHLKQAATPSASADHNPCAKRQKHVSSDVFEICEEEEELQPGAPRRSSLNELPFIDSDSAVTPLPCPNSWSQMILRHTRKHKEAPPCIAVLPARVSYTASSSAAAKRFKRTLKWGHTR